jgi:hypothetical protein
MVFDSSNNPKTGAEIFFDGNQRERKKRKWNDPEDGSRPFCDNRAAVAHLQHQAEPSATRPEASAFGSRFDCG